MDTGYIQPLKIMFVAVTNPSSADCEIVDFKRGLQVCKPHYIKLRNDVLAFASQ